MGYRVNFDCQKCEAYHRCDDKPTYSRVSSSVNWEEELPIMLITDYPTNRDNELGIPVVGVESVYLSQLLDAVGLKPDLIYITSAVKCPLEEDRKTPLVKEQLKPCFENNLLGQIDRVKPKVILNFGGFLYKWLVKPKTLNLQKSIGHRENVSLRNETILLFTYPSLSNYKRNNTQKILRSLHEVKQMLEL